MEYFAIGPYIPVHRALAASTDWRLFVGLVVVMAIVLTGTVVYANRSVKTLPPRSGETVDAERKAA